MSARIHLILGGARSGKSRHAQAIAEAFDGALVFIATGEAHDAEMAARIDRHRADRGARWRTVEAPLALAEAIRRSSASDHLLLIDWTPRRTRCFWADWGAKGLMAVFGR